MESGISSEVTNFLFNEAKEKIRSVNKDSDILDKKSFTIITVMLSILGIIASFSVDSKLNESAIVAYCILGGGFLVSLFLLVKVVATLSYYGDSFRPSQILEADKYYLQNTDALINGFLLSWYDQAIDKNIKKNKKRAFYINLALLLSLCSLAIFTFLVIT